MDKFAAANAKKDEYNAKAREMVESVKARQVVMNDEGEHDCEGKVVSRIVCDDEHAVIHFTDNTFVMMGAYVSYSDSASICFTDVPPSRFYFVNLGLVTKEEMDELDSIAKEAERLRNEALAIKSEEEERALLAELKAKYEPGTAFKVAGLVMTEVKS